MKKVVMIAIGVVVAGGIAYYFYQNTPSNMPTDGAMMKEEGERSDEGMMKAEDMMKSEDAMMEDEGTMKSEDAMMEDEGMMNSEEAVMEQSGPVYAKYSDGVIGKGQMSILFFHASWCPSCKKADADLKEIYGTGGATVSTYKVDYDTQKDLKEKYGITSQHTFVVINGEGDAVKLIVGPTIDQIKTLVL